MLDFNVNGSFRRPVRAEVMDALSCAIRPFRPSDGAALLMLHRRAIFALAEGVYTDAECESWAHGLRARVYAEIAADREKFVVAGMAHGAVGGYCSYTMRDEDVGEICGLYTDPLFQRRGLGTALMHRAEGDLAVSDAARIKVRASLAAAPFYERRGYAVVEHVRWKTRGGLEIATIRMLKAVHEPG